MRRYRARIEIVCTGTEEGRHGVPSIAWNTEVRASSYHVALSRAGLLAEEVMRRQLFPHNRSDDKVTVSLIREAEIKKTAADA